MLIGLHALLGVHLALDAEFQLREIHYFVDVIITLDDFDILVDVVGEIHIFRRLLAHMHRDLTRLYVELLLGGLAEHVAILVRILLLLELWLLY